MKVYNAIISMLASGTTFWLIGIDNDDKRFKVVGAFMILVSIIINMLNNFNII